MKYFINFFLLFFLLISSLYLLNAQTYLGNPIIDFEEHNYQVTSFPGEDNSPDSWEINSDDAAPGSNRSLHLYGNTWKQIAVEPYLLEAGEIWSIQMKSNSLAEIQGFGLSDGENQILYSIFGTQIVDIETWISVNQGAFPGEQWVEVLLPVADDWLAFYDNFSEITSLIFVNDMDSGGSRSCRFDDVYSINKYIPLAPQVSISYTSNGLGADNRSFTIKFNASVIDEDSYIFDYLWMFGDGTTSNLQSPTHYYNITGSSDFSVILKVSDEDGNTGWASCKIKPDPGNNDMPMIISFVGDIMMARRYEQAGGIIPENGVNAIFDQIRPQLSMGVDYTVANLECPLTTHPIHHPTKTIYFKSNPDNVTGLSFAGIDHVCLANNHVIDYNEEGMLETMQVLAEQGISYAGAGSNSFEAYQPTITNIKGLSIALLASSDRTGQYNNYQPYLQAGYNKFGFAYMTPYYVQQQIESVQDLVDLVVVETHCGSEYSTSPGSNYDYDLVWNGWLEEDFNEDEDYTPRIDIPHMWDIEIRHHFIDSGADLVICHHPHIIQGFELYNGKLIAHSLGNFVFDLNYPETMPTMILKTYSNENGFYNYEILPAFLDNYIPRPGSGEFGNHLLDYLARCSKDMNTYLAVDREACVATVITDTLNMQPAVANYYKEITFQEEDNYFISPPIPLEKVGNISELSILSAGNYEYRVGREMVWFGNYEDEGCTFWDINSNVEAIYPEDGIDETAGLVHLNSSESGSIATWFKSKLKRWGQVDYSAYSWIKGVDVQSATLSAKWYISRNQTYSSESYSTSSLSGTFDWTFIYKDFTIDESSKYFYLKLESEGTSSEFARTYFDNTGLIGWEEWKPVSTEIISNPNDYYFMQIRSSENVSTATVLLTELDYSGNYQPEIIRDESPGITNQGKIASVYPNPFIQKSGVRGGTTIKLAIKKAGKVKLEIFNIKGQRVITLLNEKMERGNHKIFWNGYCANGKHVASGIYLMQLLIDNTALDARKCLILK